MEAPPLSLEASLPSNTLPCELQSVLKEEDSSDFQWQALDEKLSSNGSPRVLLLTVEYIADGGENRILSVNNYTADNNRDVERSNIDPIRFQSMYNTLVLPSSSQNQFTNAFVVLPTSTSSSRSNLLVDPSDDSNLLVSHGNGDDFKSVALDSGVLINAENNNEQFVLSAGHESTANGLELGNGVTEDDLLSQSRVLFYPGNCVEDRKLSAADKPDTFISTNNNNNGNNNLLDDTNCSNTKVMLDNTNFIIDDSSDLKDEELLLAAAEQNANLLIKNNELMEVDTFSLTENNESVYMSTNNNDDDSRESYQNEPNNYLLPFVDVDNTNILQPNLEVLCSDNNLLLYDKSRLRRRKKHPAQHLGFDYWCEDCEDPFGRKCPIHDIKTILDKPVLPRARATLPKQHLAINKVPGHEGVEGVFARKTIPRKVQFGPVEGIIIDTNSAVKREVNEDSIELLLEVETGQLLVVDVSDEGESNWMRYVRRAKSAKEQNLLLTQQGKSLYFITTRVISPRQELKVGYSLSYAKKRGLTYHNDETTKAQTALSSSWNCFDCSQRFATHAHLFHHDCDHEMRSESNIKKKCSKLVKDNSQTSNYERVFKCNICYKTFPRQYSLKRHLMFVHPVKNDDDDENDCSSLLRKKLLDGVTGEEEGEEEDGSSVVGVSEQAVWLCTHCNLTFDNPSVLNLHTLTHAAQDLESAVVSGLPSELTTVYHDGEFLVENGRVQCPQCAVQFPTKRELIDHVTAHGKLAAVTEADVGKQQQQPPTTYKCEHCYKSFATELRLQRHVLVHGSDDVKPYQCTTCLKRFLNKSALTCHSKTHYDKKCFECPLCKKEIGNVFGLKEHVKVHAVNGRYTCPHCSKVFESYRVVRKHVRAFHSSHMYSCKECGKTCTTLDKLKMHSLRHSDHREFLCADCGKQFKRKDKLKEHMKRMHSIERELKLLSSTLKTNNMKDKRISPKMSPLLYERYIYKCRPCMVGFKRRGMLVNHLANRHPEIVPDTVPELNLPILRTTRDYFCQYCDKVYKSSSKRKAHILKNHPGAELPMSNRQKGGVPNIPGLPNPTYSQTVGSVKISPHNCHLCYKQYASKAKLLQHQRKKHSGQKNGAPPALSAEEDADETEDKSKSPEAVPETVSTEFCSTCPTNDILIDANILKKSLKELPENILFDHAVSEYHKVLKVVTGLKENVNIQSGKIVTGNSVGVGVGSPWQDTKLFPRHPPR